MNYTGEYVGIRFLESVPTEVIKAACCYPRASIFGARSVQATP